MEATELVDEDVGDMERINLRAAAKFANHTEGASINERATLLQTARHDFQKYYPVAFS
jgi:hypothetical protein